MTNIAPRTWVLMGFGISLLAVVINVFVISGINDRIKETDGELSKLTTSLSTQATELNRAEIKRDLFTVLNNVSHLATGEEKKLAGMDAAQLLQGYLKRNYAAVNDIPTSEMLKADNEEWALTLEYITKILEAEKQSKEGNIAETERLLKEANTLEETEMQPKSELGKKLWELESHADPEALADKNTAEIFLAIIPYIKTSNEQFIANYQKKEARIKELQDRKSNLSGWQSLFTYLAVSLQLFGLMFVLTKDLVKDTKERRDRAEKEMKKAEEEARAAEIEAAEAKARAKQANIEADKVEADAEQRIGEAHEAIEEAMGMAGAAKEDAEKRLTDEDEEEEVKL